jgi:uncharacterized protein YbjT (DUF2867 family)/nitroimidazol reductase NimA-like FMN-containing flavoprotein (pyridoxamine 5'-phosphate oxidase superfamily)
MYDQEAGDHMHTTKETILVLGATGYVGGRLVPMLLDKGYHVRAGARSASKLACRPYGRHPHLEIVSVDVLDRDSLERAATGCKAAYYLVHAMQAKTGDFSSTDRTAAENMVAASAHAGLEQIIYLGGLGNPDKELSEHLKSRMEVGEILSQGEVPVTWLRAAMILGAGSASFEILRYLADRLPIMLTPKWVRTRCQPIAISNVLGYLVGCLQEPATRGQVFDIGGPDILSYEDLFQTYAREAGLKKRIIIPVPLLTPWLSSHWISLVTPLPKSIAKPLAEGLKNEVVCADMRIAELIPQDLLTCREAISRALQRVRQQTVDTCWSDAGTVQNPEWMACGDNEYARGTVLSCNYSTVLQATPAEVWESIQTIGGERGWYFGNLLWKIRGFIDKIIGGVGLRRGRRDPRNIRVGDALDFWRVLDVQENRKLTLLAEMKVPGEALLEFTLTAQGAGRTELYQSARFLPRGLWGLVYWYLFAPFHVVIFKGMLSGITKHILCPVITPPVRAGSKPACVLDQPLVEEVRPGIMLHEHPDWQEKLSDFFASQKSMVLATRSASGPYCSLMAFAVTPDLTTIVLATPRRTLKYENMIAHPAVSLLADNRDNSSDDPHTAMAVTVLGTASELFGSSLEAMRSLFKDRHPGLGGFVTDPDTAICAVQVFRYLVVERFQDVQEILVNQDQAREQV